MSRLEFSKKVKRAAYERSGGYCECARIEPLHRPHGCNQKLTEGRIRYEHINPDAIRPDNSLENCAVLNIGCWKEKTAKYDLPTIAKSNRVRDRARGIRRRSSRPMPCGKDSPFKKTFNRGVVRRAAKHR